MSVIDTLEICFQANLNGVDAQLSALSGQLAGLTGAAQGAQSGFRTAGEDLTHALGEGLAAGFPMLARQAEGASRSLREGLARAVCASGAAPAGLRLAGDFASGVRLGEGLAASAAQSVAAGADFSGGAGSARSAGRALSEGFAAGIRDRSGAVTAAVSAVVNSATARMRKMLSIHSPSKVAEGFGAFFGEGFAIGIESSAAKVERAADGLSRAASAGVTGAALPQSDGADVGRAVQSAVESALGGVQLTIPLNVDGVKLGEASIRGINAVTRSAGRLLLNI